MHKKLEIRIATAYLILLSLVGYGSQATAQVHAYWVGAPTQSVSEGAPSVVFNMALSAPANGFTGVHYQIQAGGTATDTEDYVSSSGWLFWEDGQSQAQTVTISIVDDEVAEDDEYFDVEMDDSDGALLTGGDTVLRILIRDDDSGVQEVSLAKTNIDPGTVFDMYCPDEQNNLYFCDTTLIAQYQDDETLSVTVKVDPAPVAPDVVNVSLESYGAISLTQTEVSVGSTGYVDVPFTVPSGVPFVAGGVQILTGKAAGSVSVRWGVPKIGALFTNRSQIIDCFNCIGHFFLTFECTYNCGNEIMCADQSSEKSATSDLDYLRRYRDEILAATPEGLAVASLYVDMSHGLTQALVFDFTLLPIVVAARNDLWPLLQNLVDGDGTMVITAGMQTNLTLLLDRFVAAAPAETATLLTDLRTAAGLDSLTGSTAAAAQASFVSGTNVSTEVISWGHLKTIFR